MRNLVLAVLGTTLTTGCIVYEDRYSWEDTFCQGRCDDPFIDPDTVLPDADPELFLSVNQGVAGELVLTTLESYGRRDFSAFQRLEFQRDVEVRDQVIRDSEVALLLFVRETAAPGSVEAIVTWSGDQQSLLGLPFEVVGAPSEPSDTSDTADTGTPTDTSDTGGSTTDTDTDADTDADTDTNDTDGQGSP